MYSLPQQRAASKAAAEEEEEEELARSVSFASSTAVTARTKTTARHPRP